MVEVVGNLWKELGKADVVLVTTNSYVNKQGGLVMGRGAAREAASRFPDLPRILGEWVASTCGHLGDYGVVFVSQHILKTFSDIGAFQVKRDFRDRADLGLIRLSVDCILKHSGQYARIAMNYPGIGNGGLDRAQVEPIIRRLPDNVFVYRLPEGGEGWTRRATA